MQIRIYLAFLSNVIRPSSNTREILMLESSLARMQWRLRLERRSGAQKCPRIATGCTRSTLTAYQNSETKALSLIIYLNLRSKQIFSVAAAIEHPLHESSHNPLSTQRHTKPCDHFTTPRVRILPPPLGKSRPHGCTKLRARALATWNPNSLFWKKPHYL